MAGRNKPAWWALYTIVLVMVALIVAAALFLDASLARQDTLIVVVVGHVLVALWVSANQVALISSDRERSPNDQAAGKTIRGEKPAAKVARAMLDAQQALPTTVQSHYWEVMLAPTEVSQGIKCLPMVDQERQ
jgi:hypothetical protein